MSPSFASSIAFRVNSSASPSSRASRASVVAFLAPLGRPPGFPDWPGLNGLPGCFLGVFSAVNGNFPKGTPPADAGKAQDSRSDRPPQLNPSACRPAVRRRRACSELVMSICRLGATEDVIRPWHSVSSAMSSWPSPVVRQGHNQPRAILMADVGGTPTGARTNLDADAADAHSRPGQPVCSPWQQL
jgi:hypothetical protein